MIFAILLSVGIAVVALSPALLALRHLGKPRAEAAVSWWRLAGPAAFGIAVGVADATVMHAVQHSDCGDPNWGCLGLMIATIVVGVPVAVILGCLVLWAARTPRPWLVGLAGLPTGWVLLSAYSAVAVDAASPGNLAPQELPALVSIVCFAAGYLLAAVAI